MRQSYPTCCDKLFIHSRPLQLQNNVPLSTWRSSCSGLAKVKTATLKKSKAPIRATWPTLGEPVCIATADAWGQMRCSLMFFTHLFPALIRFTVQLLKARRPRGIELRWCRGLSQPKKVESFQDATSRMSSKSHLSPCSQLCQQQEQEPHHVVRKLWHDLN